jgi:hypothetical protein
VKPEDRALYLQILKSVGGNVSAALAALAAAKAKQVKARRGLPPNKPAPGESPKPTQIPDDPV